MEKSTTKKTPVKKVAAKPVAKSKAKAPAKEKLEPVSVAEVAPEVVVTPKEVVAKVIAEKPAIAGGRYVFATGRRKTAVANVRLFSGKGEFVVNKKPIVKYFFNSLLVDRATKPLSLLGLSNDFNFTATINGGGINAQADALAHALSRAFAITSADLRLVLKKNGLMTRDSRKKERKKPGLRRARRAPQWAKR